MRAGATPPTPPWPDTARPTPEEVAAFLRAHPGWLAGQPELYLLLDPPRRVHGERLADHLAAMVEAARAREAAAAAAARAALATRRQASSLAGRVQEAVLALLRAADPLDWLGNDLPGLLGLDAAHLCAEPSPASPVPAAPAPAGRPGARALAAGQVGALLGARAVLVRPGGADAPALHGAAACLARAEALVRLTLPGPPALLALAARSPAALPREGEAALLFLGQALAAALQR